MLTAAVAADAVLQHRKRIHRRIGRIRPPTKAQRGARGLAWPTASCKRLQTNNQTVSMLVLRGRCAEIDGLLASCADRGLDRRYGARGVRGVIGGTARSGVTSSARDDGAREAAHARGSSRSSRSDGAPDQQPLQPIVLTLYWRAWTSCKRTVLQKQRYTVSLFRRRAPVGALQRVFLGEFVNGRTG